MSTQESDKQPAEETGSAPAKAAAAPQSFSLARRSGAKTRFFINGFLVLYILFVVNGIAFRHPGRLDLTEERTQSLSDETRKVLGLIDEEIRIVLPWYVQKNNGKQAAHVKALNRAHELLQIYTAEQPLIRVSEVVNVPVEASRWQAVCKEYNLFATQFNRLIFCSGKESGLRQTVMPEDVASFADTSVSPAEPLQITSFHAEKAITEAINRLIHRQRFNCYFTQGHGEFQLEGVSSLEAFKHDLDASGFEVRALQPDRLGQVPQDCDLLVIACPQTSFTQSELAAVETYLAGGGKLLVTLGPNRSRLESVLEKWGVEVLAGKVRSKITQREDFRDRGLVISRSASATHPVTALLLAGTGRRKADFGVGMIEPRPLKVVGSPYRLSSEVLLATGGDIKAAGISERYYLVDGTSSGSGSSAEARSNFKVAIATQQEKLERPPEDWQALDTRVIVLGSGSLLEDNYSQGGGFLNGNHRDLVMNCVHWLVDREELVSGGGSNPPERKIELANNPSLERFLFVTSVLVFPGVFLLLGVFVYFFRRS